jgi:hypothetical protein
VSRDRRILDELGQPVSAPDQTDAIMGRLGYVRATERDARLQRRLRAISRVAFVFLAGAMVGVAMEVSVQTGTTRGPEGPSISDAWQNELQNKTERLDRTIKLFQDIAPASHGLPAPLPPPHVDEESAIAAVQWI